MKPKDLVGIPWMLAFALRADGWYLRSDIIWHKPNPMPESVTDRPTKSHEYIFLLSKSQHYFYDAEAIKEQLAESTLNDNRLKKGDFTTNRPERDFPGNNSQGSGLLFTDINGRNKRSVWTVSSKPFSEAHFATFPEDLISDCIRAGSSEYGCCEKCGSPYERVVSKKLTPTNKASYNSQVDSRDLDSDGQDQGSNRMKDGHKPEHFNKTKTKGWQPTCKCNAAVIKSVVLDPFSGAGTTNIVAEKLNRNHVGIELNPKYIDIYERRRQKTFGLFA